MVTFEYFEVNGMVSLEFQGPVLFVGKENPSINKKNIIFKHTGFS